MEILKNPNKTTMILYIIFAITFPGLVGLYLFDYMYLKSAGNTIPVLIISILKSIPFFIINWTIIIYGSSYYKVYIDKKKKPSSGEVALSFSNTIIITATLISAMIYKYNIYCIIDTRFISYNSIILISMIILDLLYITILD